MGMPLTFHTPYVMVSLLKNGKKIHLWCGYSALRVDIESIGSRINPVKIPADVRIPHYYILFYLLYRGFYCTVRAGERDGKAICG